MADVNLKIRAVLLFEFKLGVKVDAAVARIQSVFGRESVTIDAAQLWYGRFESGVDEIEPEKTVFLDWEEIESDGYLSPIKNYLKNESSIELIDTSLQAVPNHFGDRISIASDNSNAKSIADDEPSPSNNQTNQTTVTPKINDTQSDDHKENLDTNQKHDEDAECSPNSLRLRKKSFAYTISGEIKVQGAQKLKDLNFKDLSVLMVAELCDAATFESVITHGMVQDLVDQFRDEKDLKTDRKTFCLKRYTNLSVFYSGFPHVTNKVVRQTFNRISGSEKRTRIQYEVRLSTLDCAGIDRTFTQKFVKNITENKFLNEINTYAHNRSDVNISTIVNIVGTLNSRSNWGDKKLLSLLSKS